VPFDKLLLSIAMGNRDEDSIISLAGRLSALDREIEDKERKEIQTAAGGIQLRQIINKLFDAADPDSCVEKAKQLFQTEAPTEEQQIKAKDELAKEACLPFDNPKLRSTLIDIKKQAEQIIDDISLDTVLSAGFDARAKEKAEAVVKSFKEFIEINKDELTALQIIYNRPFAKQHITLKDIRELADAIRKPPRNLTPDTIWQAYEILERSKVKGLRPSTLLTNMISLIRFTEGQIDVLEPFPETVDIRFRTWLIQQEQLGKKFTPEQMEWLNMIKEHIGTSLEICIDDLELTPFDGKGGPVKASQLFGNDLGIILDQLNDALVA
jgi:type I restriction enzyme R subunit